jgi:excisionase family DNA binding protein
VKPSLTQPAEVREVMDIRQAAHYLGISADSLYRYAASGFIPAFRLGNRWRFRKSRLDEWMDRSSGIAEAPAPKLVRGTQKKPVRSARVLTRSVRTGS